MEHDENTGTDTFAAAWYPDPDGRHEQRYFDGKVWTERVRTAGVERTDLLDGSYLAPGASTTMADFYPGKTRSSLAERPVARNAPGTGLVLAGIGWVVMAACTQFPWNSGMALFALDPQTGSARSADAVSQLQTTVAVVLAFLILVIVGTTLRYQPGRIFGFFYGGLLGLLVCWRKIDRDDTSIRSNLLGALIVIVDGIVIWGAVHAVTRSYEHLRLGSGVLGFALGMVLVLLGVLAGRRRVFDLVAPAPPELSGS